uniref:ATP synthase complex subunit 8 n=1 Tax=Cassida sp. EMHAU-15090501 TaxID=2480058 RepID=A0A3G3C769_9CUCU|nr:ATP synthase F0 subunit 8 [Cassida sp. EMHAU-15090501]
MPQMAPLNWLNLFFMTIFIIMSISTSSYFSFMFKPKKKLLKGEHLNNWKW